MSKNYSFTLSFTFTYDLMSYGSQPVFLKLIVYRVLQNIVPPLHSKTGQYLNVKPFIFGKHISIQFCMQNIRPFG